MCALDPNKLANQRMAPARQPDIGWKPGLNVLQSVVHLKSDFAMNHAPVQNFFGNWLWWLASSLAYNVARWLRVLALPESFATCRGKRLRTSFLNVAAKVVRHERRLLLRLPAGLVTGMGSSSSATGTATRTPGALAGRQARATRRAR